MKITSLETITISENENILWVLIYTDEGFVGLGETFGGALAVEAYIHEFVSMKLLGKNPLEISLLQTELTGYLGFIGTGVEKRGNSTIDIALWDILGKVSSQPLVQLLGGQFRKKIRTYNTCAGSHYIRTKESQVSSNWGLDKKNKYDDLNSFLTCADELALSLYESGISAMKIWPFDEYAEKSNGLYISSCDLNKALEPFEKIRNVLGNKMDIMVEFHSLWNLPTAIKIAKALEPYNTFWHEDPIKMTNVDSLKRYASSTSSALCASETIGSHWSFKDLLVSEAASFIMPDLSWCGGVSDAKRIAQMAESFHLPVAPHDCTGPVVLTASLHLSLNAPNALFQESVRAFYNGWYKNYVDALPIVKDGYISLANDKPGLGIELLPDIRKKKGVSSRISKI